jgi:hypothetical protein
MQWDAFMSYAREDCGAADRDDHALDRTRSAPGEQ